MYKQDVNRYFKHLIADTTLLCVCVYGDIAS